MGVIQRDTEFAPTQPADIVRDERSTVERRNRIQRMQHVAPLARCERTGSGLSIGIAHIRRQDNPPPITSKRASQSWASVFIVAAVAALCGILLAHALAGGFRTEHHVKVTGATK